MTRAAGGVDVDEVELLRHDAPIARRVDATIDHSVLEVHEHARRVARIGVVDEHGALAQQRVVALDDEVDGAVKQRVARGDELGQGAPIDCDELFVESDPLVAA